MYAQKRGEIDIQNLKIIHEIMHENEPNIYILLNSGNVCWSSNVCNHEG